MTMMWADMQDIGKQKRCILKYYIVCTVNTKIQEYDRTRHEMSIIKLSPACQVMQTQNQWIQAWHMLTRVQPVLELNLMHCIVDWIFNVNKALFDIPGGATLGTLMPCLTTLFTLLQMFSTGFRAGEYGAS